MAATRYLTLHVMLHVTFHLSYVTCYSTCYSKRYVLEWFASSFHLFLLFCFRFITSSSYIYFFIWNFSLPSYHLITYSLNLILHTHLFLSFRWLDNSRNGQSSEGHRHASSSSIRGRHFLHHVQQRKSRHILHSGNQINKEMSELVCYYLLDD